MLSGLAPRAMRSPISRVRSVTLTSMMFMIPMPPTRSETAATLASSVVIVSVPCCRAPAISLMLRIEKSSSSRGDRWWRSRSSAVMSFCARDDVLGRRRLDVDRALQVVVEAPLDLPREGRERDERGVVVVLTARRLPLADCDADDREGRAADAHVLADGIGVGAEELLDDRLAEDDDLRARLDVLPR